MKMSFQLKERSYGWRDLVGIPMSCEPFCALALLGQKLLTAFVNVLWVPVEAAFIDTALACAVGEAQPAEALPFLAAMLLIVFWKRMGFSLGQIAAAKLRTALECQMRAEIVKKRSRLKYSLIEEAAAWELCRRVSKELLQNMTVTLPQVCDLLILVIRIVGVLIIVFVESPVLGVGMLIIMAPMLYASVKSGRQTYNAYQKASEDERRADYLQSVMTGREALEERTLFDYTDYVNRKWNSRWDDYRRTELRATTEKEVRGAVSGMVTNVASTAIIVALAWELYRGSLGIGIFIALSKAIYDMLDLMYNQLGRSFVKMTRALAFMKDLTAFVNLPEADGATDLPAEAGQVFESLEFRSVSFRYPGGGQYILKNLSMKLTAGAHYAFVGENGAGKTTITKLMTGLYDGYEGSILLNGKELREYPLAQLKAMYANVYQDFARYQDTVENNLELGEVRSMGTPQAQKRAAQLAEKLGIGRELSELPKGFQTMLGKLEDGSVDLSGGQWQRVAMARSLMNPAPVQILDEPTAALDPVSESRLYEELGKISAGRTTVFISHRLGSTKLADHIFVLKDGGVCEEGAHEELLLRGGLYRQMYDSQKSWYETEQREEGAV